MSATTSFHAFARLIGDIRTRVGRRFLAVAMLAATAAFAEGAGILLLLPLLDLAGVTGEVGATRPPWLGEAAHRLGLEGALVIYMALIVTASGVVWARTVAGGALVLDYGEDLRRRLYGALMAMEWREAERCRQSDLTLALTGEAARSAHAVDQVVGMLAASLQLPALLVAAALLSPGFTLGALGLAVVLTALVRPLSRRAYALGRALGEAARAFHGDVSDQVAGLRILKVQGAAGAPTDRSAALAAEVRERQRLQQRAAATTRLVQQVAAAAAAALALWTGLRWLGLGPADMLVLLTLFARLMPAALRVQEGWRTILQQLPSHERLMADLDAWTAAAEPEAAPTPPRLTRSLELAGVSYRHPSRRTGPPALEDVHATLPAFATTALIGPSGSGKSTLADVAMGLTAPEAGELRIDGAALDGPARIAWRRRVGYVPQDPFLFHRSVRDNLLLARPEASEAELWAALETAAAAGLVRALPQGLDTPVGDRGAKLSGGERQRIALARALLGRPDLLILDEATSALDAETERLIAEALARVHGTCTILVIAHRPGTVRDADHVLILEGGRVAAAGTWADVRARAPERLAALDMSGG